MLGRVQNERRQKQRNGMKAVERERGGEGREGGRGREGETEL